MQALQIELENCYGIKELKFNLDFTKNSAVAIYAPNGAMKSSLAQTFKDVAMGTDSKDRIFPARKTVRRIVDHANVDLLSESVVVIEPYDAVYGHTAKTSTLLLDSKLKEEYVQLHVGIASAKEAFIKALKTLSGSKKDLEAEIAGTFTPNQPDFFKALGRVQNELSKQKDAPFASVKYDRLFDEKLLAFLDTADFKEKIQQYTEKYNQLLAASTYFKKGTFNYFNAATIAKSLADNGFFNAKHSVSLNAGTKREIKDEKELIKLIEEEKKGITEDAELKKRFDEIEKNLNKNADLRNFQAYLQDNEHLLPHLANIAHFREEVWRSYFKEKIDLYDALMSEYDSAAKRKEEIEAIAAQQQTQWENVIAIFNDRFSVPFLLFPKNKKEVILGQQPVLSLGFMFKDGAEEASIEKDELLKSLSTGEKKALYVLNIIFEVERRIKDGQKTLFIVDDIADSFDYKNKYAIIEYLRDISEVALFKQVILTHNFDFFRTINSRFVKDGRMAFKSDAGLSIEKATGVKNVFIEEFKKSFFTDHKKRIASIPFIRNILEYTRGTKDAGYLKLTSLLHWKDDSASITHSELDGIYNAVFGGASTWADQAASVVDTMLISANECLTAGQGFNFENKIVMSIAIRIVAEQFMIKKIADPAFVSGIKRSQTAVLFREFKEKFSTDIVSLKVLQRVMLMTPEGIHLNLFMYEPILDMSDDHLRTLLKSVQSLK